MAYFSPSALLSGPHAGHDVRRSWHDDFLYQIQFENSIVLRTRTPGCSFISIATPHYFQWIRILFPMNTHTISNEYAYYFQWIRILFSMNTHTISNEYVYYFQWIRILFPLKTHTISIENAYYFQWIRMCILQTKKLFRHDLQRTKMTIKISEFHVFHGTGISAWNRLDSHHVNARKWAAPPDAFIGAIVFS